MLYVVYPIVDKAEIFDLQITIHMKCHTKLIHNKLHQNNVL
jgi:hypothetical protein